MAITQATELVYPFELKSTDLIVVTDQGVEVAVAMVDFKVTNNAVAYRTPYHGSDGKVYLQHRHWATVGQARTGVKIKRISSGSPE